MRTTLEQRYAKRHDNITLTGPGRTQRHAKTLEDMRNEVIPQATVAEIEVEMAMMGVPADMLATVEQMTREQVAIFQRMAPRYPKNKTIQIISDWRGGRAYAEPQGETLSFIQVNPSSIKRHGEAAYRRQITHEMSHTIEFTDDGVRQAAVRHRAQRTAGETPRKLSEHNIRYGDDERALWDEFFNPYVGKTDAGGPANFTEVVSMGMEEMWANPLELARKDPRLFDFIFDTVMAP